MKTTPVKGTKDFLPNEQELRDYIKNVIENTYKSFGFNKISTPILEDITNLKNSEGGENLKLIFEVLKRGDKFDKALECKDYENLSDLGLRYDLTLPLTRFYADNKENLPKPFKVIQIDKVYRADRPQQGRMREFYQCDIDIIGSNSLNSEVELIYVTVKALENLGLTDLVVKINNRKLLNEILLSFGYNKEELNSVCIVFDKLDKLSFENLVNELNAKIKNEVANKNFIKFLENKEIDYSNFESKKEIDYIINKVKQLNENINIEFDISLVRGQSYYTGTVFEIKSKNFNGSVAGGGRYDNLIGKFINEDVPAVGFSIGFERICSLLNNLKLKTKEKVAVFYNEENFIEKFKFAETLQQNFNVSLFLEPKKFGKFLDKLTLQGFNYFVGTMNEELKPLS